MKAIRVHEFGGPEKLKLEEVPDPRAGVGEVVVKVHAAGVNPFDTYIRTGNYAMKPSLPYTPGADAAGTVLSVGQDVHRVKVGDRVYVAGSIGGTYAEQVLCRESQVHLLSKNASFQQGAALGVPYATAFRALFQRAKALPAETVLVHGATGGVGIAAVQLARAHGMTVIGTGGSDKGKLLVKQNGAHHVVDHNKSDVPEQVRKLTDGRGVNVILEMLANQNLSRDLAMLAMHGRVVVIGSRGSIEITPRDAMARDAAILGMVIFNATEQEMASVHAGIGAALESGVARPVIDEEIPLAQASHAHEKVMQGASYGKIVLIP